VEVGQLDLEYLPEIGRNVGKNIRWKYCSVKTIDDNNRKTNAPYNAIRKGGSEAGKVRKT
jgi:hypothetical protein